MLPPSTVMMACAWFQRAVAPIRRAVVVVSDLDWTCDYRRAVSLTLLLGGHAGRGQIFGGIFRPTLESHGSYAPDQNNRLLMPPPSSCALTQPGEAPAESELYGRNVSAPFRQLP